MALGDTSKSPRMQADKLRQVFNAKHNTAELVLKNVYDQRDVDNVASNDLYVSQFIRETETIQDAAERLHETLKWRNETKVRDITEESFRIEDWNIGAMYFHNTDKDGRKLLWFKVKLHKKDSSKLPEYKRFINFYLETFYNDSPEEEMVVFFDMSDAGLSNLDMDIIKHIITCFKIYYPKQLGYMLIYEMPWLFNAAWKVIKTWLSPEAVKKLKFVSKSTVQEYIDKDQLPEHIGGTDNYKFKYVPPEQRDLSMEDSELDRFSTKKRVTFADQNQSMYKSFSSDNLKEDSNSSASNTPSQSIKPTLKAVQRRDPVEDNTFVGRLLTISPADELVFTTDEQGKEVYNIISLKNTLPYQIAFKVKTTSPEKYKVRPSSGVVKPGTVSEVFVYIHQGYINSPVEKDKFLIMAMEMTGDAPENLTDLWRSVQRENIMEHRLRCVQGSKVPQTESYESLSSHPVLTDTVQLLHKKVDNLTEYNRKLQSWIYVMLGLQVLFMVIVCILMMYGFSQINVPVNSTANSFCGGGLF